jgi:hypothetical protein
MSTNLWTTLAVALALWAIVGWWSGWCLARFFAREALHEHRVALLVCDWLGKEQAKRAKSEGEARKLRRTVAKLRWHVRYHKHPAHDEYFFLDVWKQYVLLRRQGAISPEEREGMVVKMEHFIARAIREWREARAEGNWGKYLAREREIREKAGVSNSAKDKDRIL